MALTAIDPDGVLAMSAATLATSLRVEEDAVAVQEQIDGVAGLVGHRIDIRTRTSTLAGDLAELAGWAREIVLRYVDDEKPINDLMTMGFWMPDFSKLGWDGELSAGENVDKTVRSDEFGAFVLGTSGMLLDRYRRFSLYVPNRNGPVPLPPLQLPAPDDFVHGRPLVQLPSGLFVPQGGSADPTVARLAAEADGPRFHKPGAVSFVDDIGYGRPPAWARVGGRVLGAAGGVPTVYDSYMTPWEHDEKYHP